MRSHNRLMNCRVLTACLLAIGAMLSCTAAPASAGGPTKPAKVVRELFVPMEDLNILLENQPRRVLLSREEYDALLSKAHDRGEALPPQSAMLTDGVYSARLRDGRATIDGVLGVEVLADGAQAVPLELGRVGLKSATLDGQPAPLGQDPQGRLVLLVEGRGRHELRLALVAPVETTAATQVLGFRLPTPPAARFELVVDGDVEVKSGLAVVGRRWDSAAGVTRFELLPRGGEVSLAMTLNSRLLRKDQTVIGRTVLLAALTEGGEQVHATVSLSILHRAVDRFRFAVPEGFEITGVHSPHLSSWAVAEQGGRRVLEARLREATTEKVVLSISAMRGRPRLDKWTLPRLRLLDADGEATVVALLLDERLKPKTIRPKGLISIDTAPLEGVIPAAMRAESPLAAVAAYYAPGGDWSLAASFERPPARLAATTVALLTLSDRRQRLAADVLLAPEHEPLFEVDLHLPAAWHVERVTDAEGRPIAFQRHKKAARLHVALAQGIRSGQQGLIRVEATSTPPAWLGDWEQTTVEFPDLRVTGDVRRRGAIAVVAEDDLLVRPREQTGLAPLGESEKKDFQLAGVKTDLAYRHEDGPFRATMKVERTAPRLVGRTYSFLRVEPGEMVAHYEIVYDVTEARARSLRFTLPASTPTDLAVRGLGGVAVKQWAGKEIGQRRQWTGELADPRRGQIALAVDFQQPLGDRDPQDLPLPIVVANGVAHQSGLVAVEGSAELDVQVKTSARAVDVGELVDAEYQPGRRLLGVYSFVGTPAPVTIDACRHPAYSICTAIVERGWLVTRVSAEGVAQTEACYRLRAKAPYLDVELPERACLWSAQLDGKPIKPQRQGQRLLVDLAGDAGSGTRELRLFYEMPVSPVNLLGRMQLAAPTLLLCEDKESRAVEVPVVAMEWKLMLPCDWQIVHSRGTLASNAVQLPEPALFAVGRALGFVAVARPNLGCSNRVKCYAPACAVEETVASASAKSAVAAEHYDMSPARVSLRWRRAAQRQITGELGTADRERLQESLNMLDMKVSELAKMRSDRRISPEEFAEKTEALVREFEVTHRELRGKLQPVANSLTVEEAMPQTAHGSAAAGEYPGADFGLSGARCLPIVMADAQGPSVVFESFGRQPRLAVTVADSRGFAMLGWAVGLGVLLMGLALGRRSARAKFQLVIVLGLVFSLLPTAPGCQVLAGPCNVGFYAALLLVACYLVAAVLRGLVGQLAAVSAGKNTRAAGAAAAGAILLVLGTSLGAPAAEQPTGEGPVKVELIDPLPVVRVPSDAILVPYDPDSPDSIDSANRCFVPLAQYKDLWRRANPDKSPPKPPCDYALAGASYHARLADGEDLLLEGRLEIVVHKPAGATVPLRLAGGVLADAKLDGQPARLSVAQAEPLNQTAAPGPQAAVLLLHVAKPGRHVLVVRVRLRLRRHGGWQVAEGIGPAAAASSLALTVPAAGTDVQLADTPDRRNFQTTKPDETLETALAAGGAVRLQWRPKLARAEIQHSLTARSEAVLDVQEEAIRLLWNLVLEFREDQRREFSLLVPGNYLIEGITGPNVRGWAATPSAKSQRIDVTLLKAATGSERLSVRLRRAGLGGELTAPGVAVEGAAIQQGRLAIRRSPLLEVQTTAAVGARRTDFALPAQEGDASATDSPLGLRPYQAYEFASMPFSIRLAARPIQAKVAAEVQSILKISDDKRSLESLVNLDVAGRPLYRASFLLPEGFELEEVKLLPENWHPMTTPAAGPFQWATSADAQNRRRLTLYLAGGRLGRVSVVVSGKLAEPQPDGATRLPRLEVLDVDRQQGDVAVQVDPSFEVRCEALANCQAVLLERLHGWLRPAQREITQLALHYDRPDYDGRLVLARRTPRISCTTITNVRVTEQELEETILLDFTIREAGIRRVEFTLPHSMRDCRIHVPLLQEKTIRPAGLGNDAPWRVTLDLQDDVIGQLRVLVENDRLPGASLQTAPIPEVLTGQTARRFVVLESAGRDEVVPKTTGLEVVPPKSKAYQTLGQFLGDGVTQAYVVAPDAQRPELAFTFRQREAVITAGARIGLAETDLRVDAAGAYRGRVVYQMNNTTEQFLPIKLPQGARLWSAEVAGDPVKPIRHPDAVDEVHVCIPLVRTAPGEPDYEVVLVYGGAMPPPSTLGGKVDFPLIRTLDPAGKISISPEVSQVRLHLPRARQWFDFGGTMRRAASEGELAAGQVAYKTGQIRQLGETLRTGDEFAKVRAAQNILGMKSSSGSTRLSPYYLLDDVQFHQELADNQQVLQEAQRQAAVVQNAPAAGAQVNNRQRLDAWFGKQKANASRTVVIQAGKNFGYAATVDGGEKIAQPSQEGLQINKALLIDHAAAGQLPGLVEDNRAFVSPPTGGAALGGMRVDAAKPWGEKHEHTWHADFKHRPVPPQEAPAVQPAKEGKLARYQRKYQQQAEMELGRAATYGPAGPAMAPVAADASSTVDRSTDGESGLMAADGRPARHDASVAQGQSQGGAAIVAPKVPAGQASLPVELPPPDGEYYRTYWFTTPRGDVTITARPASTELLLAIRNVLVVLAVFAALAMAAQTRPLRWFATWPGGLTLLVLGAILALSCLLPLVGVVLVGVGVVVLVTAPKPWATKQATAKTG